MSQGRPIRLTVNGVARSLSVAGGQTLLDMLRDDLGLTGTKECCRVGECGACTVSLDGRIVDACLVLAAEADGAEVTTIEGMARDGRLDPLQQAFLDAGAVQCGFCSPGQLMAARDLLARNPHPTADQIHVAMAGNLCRCGCYGQITEAVLAASTEAMTTMVGTSAQRSGGPERVTGRYQYLGDIKLPRMLHARLVTLDCARARIRSIDATPALGVPGVVLVMTAADLPQPVPRFGPQYRDRPVLAAGETHYHGEPVAAVAAETLEAAEEAARLVRVDYAELPAVTCVAAALAPGAPLVQDPALRPRDPLATTNVLHEHRYGWGDIRAAVSDLVVTGSYSFPMVTHFAVERHGCIASAGPDGITIWSTIQHPYWLQKTIADLLRLPLAKVRVVAPDPGGGFGGKQHAKYEPLIAFMAMRTDRPVRLILTLEETFQAVRRNSAEVTVRTGFRADGSITFREIRADYLLGAYADISDRVVGKGTYLACGPYRVPAASVVARSVLSHTPPATAFRGFGAPQVIWAAESNMDEAARLLGIDPLQLRLRNLARFGEQFVPGDTPADGRWEQSVRRAADLIGWAGPLPAGHGRGIAVGIKPGPTTGLSYSTVRLLSDGSVVMTAGTSDMGQGARTVFTQIAAEELGVPVDRITLVMGDTAVVAYDQQTSASRSTVLMGNAILQACREVQAKVRALAAMVYSVSEADIEVGRGRVRLPDLDVAITDVLGPGLGSLGGELIGTGECRKEALPGHPLSGTAEFYEFNCTAVEAQVDTETGEVAVGRYVTVSDVGRAMNPLQVRGQDEGAAIQGLGHTLMEHYVLDESGRICNLGAIDYRIPTSMDLPLEMTSDVVENGDGPGPYGAKGMSEGGLLAVAPAVAGAVADACGAVIHDLPLTPERVWQALAEQAPGAPHQPPAREMLSR
jgi:CO/xanthine dehydrogenase Mo-binding subunit/aerobic-type carbon monoxide dehydrogenase small subunit (CoxS/CutS family)